MPICGRSRYGSNALALDPQKGSMRNSLRTRTALAIGILLLAGCGLRAVGHVASVTPPVQTEATTGIALTHTAELSETARAKGQTETFQIAINTAVVQTEEALSQIATRVSGTETAHAPTATPPPSPTSPATPTASPTGTATPMPKPTVPQQTVAPRATVEPPGIDVYDAYQTVQALASLNDSQVVHCTTFIDKYNHMSSLPENFDDLADYATARSLVLTTSRDEMINCTDWLAGNSTSNVIPFQQWGMSRQGAEQARQLLRPLVIALGFTP
jgi:hypothetical protein